MKFLLTSLLAAAIASGHPANHSIPAGHTHVPTGTIVGHGSALYSVDQNWAKTTPEQAPVVNSHALVEGRDGLLYVVTDHPANDFVVFKKDGTFVKTISAGLGGGHGVDVIEHKGEEYLIHVDCGWYFEEKGWKAKSSNGKVTILKKDGTVVRKLPTPIEMGLGVEKFKPTDVAVTPAGTILVADGYATDFIYEMTFEGHLVRRWGGKNAGEASLKNAHGISLDLSDPAKPLVWVPSRDENKIKAFTLDGKYVETLDLPGAYAGQLFFRGDKIYTAVCWSKAKGTGERQSRSGFILVLDRKTKRVISAPGGSEPKYVDGALQPMHQTSPLVQHGHDLYVDADGAIYVGEWNADRRYPTKLTPAK